MSNALQINYLSEMDRGLAYAEACFETFRVIHGEVFLWPEHWSRLTAGLASFGIALSPADEQQVLQACLTHARQVASDCLLRLTISGGAAGWGLLNSGATTCHIQALAFKAQPAPLDVFSVEYPFNLNTKLAKYCADYSQTLRAVRLWQQHEPQLNPLHSLIEKDGLIISGLTSNILLYVDGRWLTPQGDGILPGVIRQFLIQQGMVTARPCPVALLESCEAMLMINSGQFLRGIHSINGRGLNAQHPQIDALKEALRVHKGVKFE